MKMTITIIIIIFSTFLIAAADDAVYMSKLMKALTPTPSGWSNNTHFCKWNGVVCRQSSNRVTSITLPSSSLTGTLPSDLNTLTNLTSIDLHNNSLTAPLPFLSNLNALQTVLLGHNNFTSIPNNCFSGITSLKSLNLSNNLNLVHWLFPSDLSLSKSLQTLDLQSTNIIGSLPSEMFDWFPNLNALVLSHNDFSGSLPLSLGRSSIRFLKLNNQGTMKGFVGGYPQVLTEYTWFGKDPCIHWRFIRCIRGKVVSFNLNGRNLNGIISPAVANLTGLVNLTLSANHLTGSIPQSLTTLRYLRLLVHLGLFG